MSKFERGTAKEHFFISIESVSRKLKLACGVSYKLPVFILQAATRAQCKQLEQENFLSQRNELGTPSYDIISLVSELKEPTKLLKMLINIRSTGLVNKMDSGLKL